MKFSVYIVSVLLLLIYSAGVAQTGKPVDEQRADSLLQQIEQLSESRKYKEIIPVTEALLRIYEKIRQPDHPDVAHCLDIMAEAYTNLGNYDKADSLFQQSIIFYEQTFGPNDPRIAGTVKRHGELYYYQGRYAEAESLFVRARSIFEASHDSLNVDLGSTLNNLAALYAAKARFKDAEPLYHRALAIYEQVLGPEHFEVGTSLNNLAMLYHYQGRYKEAEPLYQHALKIYEQVLGLVHKDLANSLINLAALYHYQGRYKEAEPLYLRALAIQDKSSAPDRPGLTYTLSNLAVLYKAQGRYKEAEPLYLRGLAISEEVLGPEHPDLAGTLNNLATYYNALGRYSEAEPLQQRALAIAEKAFGPDHPNVANNLSNLALIYDNQGRYQEAEPLLLRAIKIRENSLGPDHPRLAFSLNNLALLYDNQGRYQEAEPLYLRALKIREKALGPDHPDVAYSLNNLAVLYAEQRRYEEAEPLYLRALKIREHAFGPDHPDAAFSLYSLAAFYYRQGNYPTAFEYINRALDILKKTTIDPHTVSEIYYQSAVIHRALQHDQEAISQMALAIAYAEQMRPQVGGGEETRAGFFEQFADYFDRMTAWQLEAGNIEKALEYSERGRARTLVDQLSAGKIDLRSSIPEEQRTALQEREAQALADKAEYQQRITRLRSRKDLSDAEKTRMLQELTEQLNAAEKAFQAVYNEIKNASRLWRDVITSGGQPVSLIAMQNELLPRDGLMLMYQIGSEESFVFLIPPLGETVEYRALKIEEVTAKMLGVDAGPVNAANLQHILAGDKEDEGLSSGLIPALSQRSRGAVPINRTSDSRSGNTGKLHALWKVLMPDTLWSRVQASEEAVIVPDGLLYLLPFEALIVSADDAKQDIHYWLDAGPAIRYAASATTLYNIEKSAKFRLIPDFSKKQVLSLSNPVYDIVALADSLKERAENPLLSSLRNQYNRSSGVLTPLPGTTRETRVLQEIYTPTELTVLQQSAASEMNLRQNISDKRYIHLATHGIIDQQKGIAFASLALTPSLSDSAVSENDGFLQLYEIYGLKLSACELAVLSACETNVGRYIEGEGVFALTRGFLAAGARRVVASQWPVDDFSTAEIVAEFFRQIAAADKAGKPYRYSHALRDAKRKVRAQEKWADPFYWAPFVLTGKR